MKQLIPPKPPSEYARINQFSKINLLLLSSVGILFFRLALTLHLLLFLLLLHNQSLLFPNAIPPTDIESNDEEDAENEEDGTPDDSEVIETLIGHPEEETDHQTQ